MIPRFMPRSARRKLYGSKKEVEVVLRTLNAPSSEERIENKGEAVNEQFNVKYFISLVQVNS